MATAPLDSTNVRKPLRVWPGVIAAVLLVFARFILPTLSAEVGPWSVIVGAVCALLILLWWMFFSRAPWQDRLGALVLMILATWATKLVVDRSIATGFMGMMVPAYAVPATLGPALVLWAVATRHASDRLRRATMVVAIVVGCGVWTLARTDGIKGEGTAQLHWRWTPTAEQRLLAQGEEPSVPAVPPAAPAPSPAATAETKATAATPSPAVGGAVSATKREPARTPAEPAVASEPKDAPPEKSNRALVRVEWPGFRGAERDSTVRGTRIGTDWSASPPAELWRKPIGPGWSSFAVRGDLMYTQEQRGDDEVVSCYRLSTGAPVWKHRDPARFYESNGGAGPRGTPTVSGDRVYTLGATGIVNALDADSGAVVWSRNAANDTGAKLPGWGFAGSPLVVDDLVIVAASGRLAGYDIATGNPKWTRQTHGGGYSSPQLATIDGVRQVLLLSGGGVTSVSPDNGTVLWEHTWTEGVAIVQPAIATNGDLLLAAGDAMGGLGIRRIAVSHAAAGWNAQERWTSRGLKPYFNDFVVHEGYAYGFDGAILSCIDLETGERKWKGGRYGQGQLLLLADQDLLLLTSEDGDLVLVSATPDKHTEIARSAAIEGKTWNHPVLVRDTLLIRNGEQMAAFRLPRASR